MPSLRIEREYRPDLERAARALLILLTNRNAATSEVAAPEGGPNDATGACPANRGGRSPVRGA
jgi:hypothetical protein